MAVTAPLTSNRFPYLSVVVAISGHEIRVEALIDTGFDGHVIIPASLLANRAGSPQGMLRWRLGDGSEVSAPYYLGRVKLAGLDPGFPAIISILGEEPIIGRAFTNNFKLVLDHGQRVLAEA